MSCFIISLHPQILLGRSNQEECGTHARREKSVRGFWGESLKEGDHSEDQGVDGRMCLEWILGRLSGGECGVDSGVSG
jgi:hypothetical protein